MNEKGFTLIEMLVVMLVISILLLITIPNVTKHNQSIQKKGCEGLKSMIQAQITAYEIDHDGKTPSSRIWNQRDTLRRTWLVLTENRL